jgi:DNA-binding NtrC family response regulator
MSSILIVDDETGLRSIVASILAGHGYDVTEAGSGEEALACALTTRFDVVLLDLTLPGINGIETLKQLRDRDPEVPILLMTAYGSVKTAVEAMRNGAFDYLQKPVDYEELLLTIRRALEARGLRAEVAALREELAGKYGFNDIVGLSAPMRTVFGLMSKAASRDVTVLVLGESGTGKELVARAIHRTGPRAHAPFVAVNCSAIPSTLVESEFFGHERGAFTDAREARAGRFEQANGGTLFLDEIGDLPIEAQAKLLRVLQEGRVSRLGSTRESKVNVRVIAATNKNLEAAIAKGKFREDLFYRLNVVSIRLPPLRDRPEDLGLLVDSLLERIAHELNIPTPGIAPEARRQLLSYEWPGNVRELENTLRHALVVLDGGVVRLEHLPARTRWLNDAQASGGDEAALSLHEALRRATERVERGLIMAALSETRGNRSAAAQKLEINRKTLFNKMKEYGFSSESDEPDEAD